MKRNHDMPFGARCAAGEAHLRLWAPSARSVDLVLTVGNAASTITPLQPLAHGWYELRMAAAANDFHYSYRIDGEIDVPDPASRFNPLGVHAPSLLIDPGEYDWQDTSWQGRRWEDAVIYELHVGTFTSAGTFAAIENHLAELAALGVTALELMPVASFAGERGWGYDGVLPFAPHPAYGTPTDLKRLVEAAHRQGLMMILDVVYNHFGPEGNYLGRYARDFFNPAHHTPWGPAINLDGEHANVVREFFIHNALYWLNEFHFDGLRLDAIHALCDNSPTHFVEELAARIQRGPGSQREVHLILENNRNQARFLRRTAAGKPLIATAQWNDDFHHPLHVITTGEEEGYYIDYAREPVAKLGRALADGFVYQGEYSTFEGATRGESSRELPANAMIDFLQTHDQIGNRAFGERLAAHATEESLRAAYAVLLLAPSTPMLFMGEEFAAKTPFLYFCDFEGELGRAVTAGRRKEFAGFGQFANTQIPDPCDPATFEQSRIRWQDRDSPDHRKWLEYVARLLGIRRQTITPLITQLLRDGSTYEVQGTLLSVGWRLSDLRVLRMRANLGSQDVVVDEQVSSVIFSTHERTVNTTLSAWEVEWFIDSTAAA